MHRSSGLNQQRKQKVEKPFSAKFFSSFLKWRCGRSSLNEDFVHPTLTSPSSKVRSEISSTSQNDESRRQTDSTSQGRSSGHSNGDRSPTNLRSDRRDSENQTHLEYTYAQEKFTSFTRRAVSPPTKSCQSNAASLKKVNAIALCCDKCDGMHDTDSCPHYKKKRVSHLDGQKNGWKLVGGSSNLPGKLRIFLFSWHLAAPFSTKCCERSG